VKSTSRSGCEVAIIGLGGMGSAVAWQLARRGHRVIGVEKFGPAHSRGSSHGASRMVRQAYYEDPRYVPLLLRAYELWDELGHLAGRPSLVRTGGLMIGPDRGAVVTGTVASAETWGLTHEVLGPDEVARRFPAFRLGTDDRAVFEPNAGFVDPEATVAAHLDLATATGATLEFDTVVQGWEQNGSGVVIETSSGTITADHLVVCAGPWSSRVLHAPGALMPLDLPLSVERQVQHWFLPSDNPDRFALGRLPVYLWEYDHGAEFYGFPMLGDGRGAKVAFFHHGGPTSAVDPDHLDRQVRATEAESLRAVLSGRLPDLAGRWLSGAACMYTMTPDRHFVVGPVDGTEGRITVAAGFSGHGFKFVPVIGEVVADLATGVSPRLDLDLFDPGRFH
jgi:sarcosine oxidase